MVRMPFQSRVAIGRRSSQSGPPLLLHVRTQGAADLLARARSSTASWATGLWPLFFYQPGAPPLTASESEWGARRIKAVGLN